MGTSLERNLSRYGLVVLGLLVVVLLGLLMAIQACSMGYSTVRSGQEGSGTIGLAGSELTPAPRIGRLAPDFTLVDLEGNLVTLSDFRGETVFLNFWATWCPPCRAEMPEMEAVYQEYKDKGVVVIGVDVQEAEEEVRQYVQQGGYSWTFVLDTTGEVTVSYKITGIPTSFFIDREGVIQAMNIGAMTKRDMETKLSEAMR